MSNRNQKIFIENSLPNSFFHEQSILNILLTSPNNLNLIKNNSSILKSDIFYNESHRLIYESIFQLSEENRTINITTVSTKLCDTENLEKIGGFKKLISIIGSIENNSNLEEYIEFIYEKYLRRLIINIGKESILWGFDNSYNVNQILLKIEESLFYLNQLKTKESIQTAAEIIDEIYEEMKKKKSSTSGFETSYQDLDAIVQGFQKSDLIIIAGRPSMGKTAFSLNLGKNIVEKYNIPLIIFTLEMSRQQIIYRLLSSEAKINNSRIKSGKLTLNEVRNLTKNMEKFAKMPIFIDDNSNLTILDIRSKIQKIFIEKKQKGIVIIDYLQLMKVNINFGNRVQEISYLTRNLKLLAKEFSIPIILLSQLSRSVESRVNKRPMLSDLRESGCITDFNETFSKSWNLEKIINNNNKIGTIEFKGIKPTYLVTFKNNIKIQLTSNHKILSKNGWKKISELSNKSQIYCLITEENKNYEYKEVEKIEYQGIHPVYDKTIPNYHNYIVQDIPLHNSIEQDADIVIMLYRDDYYNKKTNQSQITEFIIAKHRNGALGTAKLVFNPTITKFTND